MKAEIKADELMIGNLVQDTDGAHLKVSQIVDGYIYYWSDGEEGILNVNLMRAIPLTEEWLLKFKGFEHDSWEEKFKFYGFGECEYILESQGDWFFIGINNSNSIFYFSWNIKYVHTFQNLYFTLTGTHLTM